MKRKTLICGFIIPGLMILCLTLTASAYDSGVSVYTVLKSKTASNGQALQYLKTDKPEITVAILEIAPGKETGWHLHKVPVYAYVIEGTLKVMMDGGKEYKFTKGQALLEVQGIGHNGINIGKDTVKLIVFYTGEEDLPNAIKIQR